MSEKLKKEGQLLMATGPTTKMRIQLFDPKSNLMVEDRCVSATTELIKGPSQSHKGPVLIECTLFNKAQVDMFMDYLRKLQGDLPIEEKVVKNASSKKIDKMLSDKEPLLDLIKAVKGKVKNQEELMDYLREYQFKFVSTDVVKDATDGIENLMEIKENHLQFQWMVRLVKEAKDPSNDKYDWRLMFGIKLLGDKLSKVVIYLWGKWSEKIELPWKDAKSVNFKKVDKVYTFPDFMDIDDRKRWRKENRALISTPEKEASKFFVKWTPYIRMNGKPVTTIPTLPAK